MTRKLSDLCAAIVDCEHKTAPVGNGYAFSIGTKAMKNGRLVLEACKPVDEETFRAWTRRLVPEPGDLVLAREAPVGDVVRVPLEPLVCLGQRTVLVRPDSGLVDPRFLHYWLLGPTAQSEMASKAAGATVPHLNVEDIRALNVAELPANRGLQERAAAILGAIDDLIWNKRRRISVLEQMVQAIYREWFVQFRYPGHEDDDVADSPLGPIPAGWEVIPVSDAVEINPSVRAPKGSEVPFVAMSDLTPGLMLVEPGSTRLFGTGGSRFTQHDTLFARITPSVEHGKTGFVQFLSDGDVGMGSTEFLVFRGTRVSPYSTYLLARRDDLRLHAVGSMSGASGRQRVNNACFDTFAVAVPPVTLERRFANCVAPAFALVEVLSQLRRHLERLRDLLLPRLVTGAIDVSKLDLDALLDESAA